MSWWNKGTERPRRDRYAEDLTCVRCLRKREPSEVDRLFWCRECQVTARERAKRWGWYAGGACAAGLALWIWLYIQPSDLIIGGWIATVLAAFYLSGRLARELFYGIMRIRNSRAVEAIPPELPRGDEGEGRPASDNG